MPTALDYVFFCKRLAYKEWNILCIFKVLPANGHGSRYHSWVALLEEMVTQQSLGSRPAEWAHSLQLIPRSVDQQLLGLLGVRVGGVEKDQGILGQDCVTHLPSVLGAVAFAVFLWFTERSDEQRNPSDAISWHPFCLRHPSHLHHRNRERLSRQVWWNVSSEKNLPIPRSNSVTSRCRKLWKALVTVENWMNLGVFVVYVIHRMIVLAPVSSHTDLHTNW